MESSPPRRSKTSDAMQRARVDSARARTPEERIILALRLGALGRALAGMAHLTTPPPPEAR